MQHHIDVGDAEPFKIQPYPQSPAVEKMMNAEVDRLLKLGIIEPAVCPKWLSPVIPVKKSDGTTRLVLDARKINFFTKKTQLSLSKCKPSPIQNKKSRLSNKTRRPRLLLSLHAR